ncbi:MAG: hypothetical protein IT419_00710 [Planctomycetes bacterium]|nr:hypothetical protein [Planctomycetota bacterium]
MSHEPNFSVRDQIPRRQQAANCISVLLACKQLQASLGCSGLICAWKTGRAIAKLWNAAEDQTDDAPDKKTESSHDQLTRIIKLVAAETPLTNSQAAMTLRFYECVPRATVYRMCRTNRRCNEAAFDLEGIKKAFKLSTRAATLEAIRRTFNEPRKLKNIASEMLRDERERFPRAL